MGLREWAERLQEQEIERGAEMHRRGFVPSVRARLVIAVVSAAVGFALVLLGVPYGLVIFLVPFAPAFAFLAAWWRRRR